VSSGDGSPTCPEVLVLYLKRPPWNSWQPHDPGRALRIQRLEGSRPEGRLCTLNGVEWVQRFKQVAVIGKICRFEVVVKRRRVAQRRSA